jgi:hypothetical protein
VHTSISCAFLCPQSARCNASRTRANKVKLSGECLGANLPRRATSGRALEKGNVLGRRTARRQQQQQQQRRRRFTLSLTGHSPCIDFLRGLFAHNSHIGILSFLPLRLVLSLAHAHSRLCLRTPPPPTCTHSPTPARIWVWAQTGECTALWALSRINYHRRERERRLRPVISLGWLLHAPSPPIPLSFFQWRNDSRRPPRWITRAAGRGQGKYAPCVCLSAHTHTAAFSPSETLPLHFCNCLIMPPRRHNDAGGKINCANVPPYRLHAPACVTPLELMET